MVVHSEPNSGNIFMLTMFYGLYVVKVFTVDYHLPIHTEQEVIIRL